MGDETSQWGVRLEHERTIISMRLAISHIDMPDNLLPDVDGTRLFAWQLQIQRMCAFRPKKIARVLTIRQDLSIR